MPGCWLHSVLQFEMKKFTIGFFLGLLVMLGVGAATDDTMKEISSTLKRIASSMEVMAGQPRK